MAQNQKQNQKKINQMKAAERLAEEVRARTSNGNRQISDSEKRGGAERGGPGMSHANAEQPPGANRKH